MTARDFIPKVGPTAFLVAAITIPLMLDRDWNGIMNGMFLALFFICTTGTIPFLRNATMAFIWSVALATILRLFICQTFYIPSGSMQPTLQPGDLILSTNIDLGIKSPFDGTKTMVRLGNPERFDVVVFTHPDTGEAYIKRVIGLPGETVKVKGTRVYVNGRKLDDPYGKYVKGAVHYNCDSVRLGSDEYFVMGDNRDDSYDSRQWGTLRREAIYAKARFVYWSDTAGSARAGTMMRHN